MTDRLCQLLDEINGCRLCEASLPLGPHPVVRASSSAKVLIIGQAPGTKVHASGIPWDDASGKRLRDWLGLSPELFYDEQQIAIMPMGFCYPGKGKQGDLPPRPECAPKWHQALLAQMPNIQLTLLIGQYAQRYYLKTPFKTLTENVKHWQNYRSEGQFPLPHPSPRNQLWLKKNPWFEELLLPPLKSKIQALIER
ncbi:uracil-DNA glycosylase family protein [Corallincola holothuriorum]|uniref:Uracil-DNA glycosylase family protein n=1 Tax=Corallincola holothuriorum TaxID=2282215 RepID=A0A368MZW7_9GAMM|nr:uracil-DNA glycosylase family protein [Corallincola holothuriorum]RCU43792.1 uracil-DNA glycosylase family protein [Corallincola holothuriorum]